MPVVRIDLPRFERMVGADRETILDRLPFVGLEHEGLEGDSIRVEYSPNRPDFGSDYGIARSLRGLLGKEVGLPRYPTRSSGIAVTVDRRLSSVRPFISCATVTGLRLDGEDIRQVISLQEDLHNGLGRKRRVAAIGLHDLDAVKPPIRYKAVSSSYRFRPLGSRDEKSIGEVLRDLPEGREYGRFAGDSGTFAGDSGTFPVIIDSAGTTLSFPPVINGDATRVSPETRNVFIDVTSTAANIGDDVLAVMATTLAEAGGKIGSVAISGGGRARSTPDLKPRSLRLDPGLVRSVLGLKLTERQISTALAKSRLEVRGRQVLGPRYRVDLMHPIDVAEEVALGYGIDRIEPAYPPSMQAGSFNELEQFLDAASTLMAESGMTELMTYELVDERTLYKSFGRSSASRISVHEPKSIDHSLLRDSLLPTLMSALTANVKEEYPQKVFEVGRVYLRKGHRVSEEWHLGCLDAHSQASYTEAKMYLEALCRTLAGEEVSTKAAEHWAFASGRCASVHASGRSLGYVGELAPQTIDAAGVNVPVAGFEIDLAALHELLK